MVQIWCLIAFVAASVLAMVHQARERCSGPLPATMLAWPLAQAPAG